MCLKIGYTPRHLPVDLGGAQFPDPVLLAGTGIFFEIWET